MVSVLDSGSSGPGSGPGQGHCVVFLSKTLPLYTHWRNAGGNPAIDLHPIQGGGGGRNTPNRFIRRKKFEELCFNNPVYLKKYAY